MNSQNVESAARFLVDARARRVRVPHVPAAYRPTTAEEALKVQTRVAELMGQSVAGWKVGMPTEARPLLYGPIFQSSIVSHSPCRVSGNGRTMKVEPEIAFVLACDIPARNMPYENDDIRTAVREVRLVVELVGPRYEDPRAVTYPELLADNVANEALYVGPVIERGLERSLATFPIRIGSAGGVIVAKEGKHPDGDPLRPLVWLANRLAQQGTPLRAGQIVTTGSYCGIVEVPLGEPVTIACEGVGAVTITLVA